MSYSSTSEHFGCVCYCTVMLNINSSSEYAGRVYYGSPFEISYLVTMTCRIVIVFITVA